MWSTIIFIVALIILSVATGFGTGVVTIIEDTFVSIMLWIVGCVLAVIGIVVRDKEKERKTKDELDDGLEEIIAEKQNDLSAENAEENQSE